MTAKHVIITGGTRGLGRALCLRFGQAGYRITAIYHSDHAVAQALEQEFKQRDIQGTCLAHDITDAKWPLHFPEKEELVLINNACSSFAPKPLHLWESQEIATLLDTNIRGSFLSIQALLRPMVRAGKGTIVNILSTVIQATPPKGFAAYACAKAGLKMLTEAVAVEYNARGIRSFSVSPSFMATDLTSDWNTDLKQALSPSQSAAQMPEAVAEFLGRLVDDLQTPGKGEHYYLETSAT